MNELDDAIEQYLLSYIAVLVAAYLAIRWGRSFYNHGVRVAFDQGFRVGQIFAPVGHGQGAEKKAEP